MANEEKKDFNAMLRKNTDMPKTQIVTDESIIKRYGGERMFFAPPLAYDELMKKVPHGKVVTAEKIREYLAEKNCADFTDPMTAGLFISIAAWASHQREENITPYWRTLKTDGELNAKYPGGIEAQKKMLEEEGHVIIQKGRKNIRFFVKDCENVLFDLH
ncbi:methylated DNA-protein cysteine methyltransferase [Candidatus Methanomassiliicoccus intestinalis]|uniref:Putative methylated DNA-protein cysteine methyltransferase n=1 Tax=Methanomassiliicoccus intestinalis (strain Issoire-Mx1) TaxID=1295009 RepID=R9TA79_METII|nr:MGMT family protein [Candidatus Methanomassiliicoccus intestinalis]AGN26561.1 putative methylated DNA-protein cysteine methyltransferase [Candidatus Methanomassiliicoccus intestinalis Issoire-Mx1]TQS84181.1 MAG: methylated DNA-protein cysteine methyltransferase [Candidatus Methanomassiliicoccus intestinalis]